ncbi:hypothetical protein CDAR_231871 [Caerostris darwini]|uniref:Peptidase A2 domain-containing protein n=1 Tax=Caerostris darwini TaxID=1538125 RepID=A0AAV4N5C4_9ARAC|nr:hypothetical protein CDAR_231871 [Caerostris darwini]
MALIKDVSGKYIKIRILLDSGSQACFLSETFAKRYSLNYDSNDRISVTGISTTPPTTTLGNGLQLADGNFFQSSRVDLIIGADKFFSIMLPGQILRANGEPIAQNTRLGWVVAGNIKDSQITNLTSANKFRAVFDGSGKTENSVSLNEMLAVGTKQQRDIFEMLLDFRIGNFAVTADITMYRQVMVNPTDQTYQRIL